MRRIRKSYLNKLKAWEGNRLKAYKDMGGVWTIGYGSTTNVKSGDVITEQEAEALLLKDLERFERRVNRLVKVPLDDSQFAALVFFDFNTGALHKSTLLKKLNAGDYDSVPDEMMRWVYVNKTKVKGLINRRTKEINLWLDDSDDVVQNNSYDVVPHKDPIISKENVSWAAGIAATAAVPLADGAGPVQWVVAGVIAVAFGVALYLFFKRRGA